MNPRHGETVLGLIINRTGKRGHSTARLLFIEVPSEDGSTRLAHLRPFLVLVWRMVLVQEFVGHAIVLQRPRTIVPTNLFEVPLLLT